MKKISMYLGTFAVCTLLSMNNPVIAQTNDNTTSTTAATTDDNKDDDTGKWGLAGLLGLIGLLGLKRRDDDKHRSTNINR